MKIESCTTSKYRDLSQPGDDILVVVPQCLYAVFDGATDTAGVSVQGESPGRLAARQAALAMVRYASAPELHGGESLSHRAGHPGAVRVARFTGGGERASRGTTTTKHARCASKN